jgi:hypothetical protein
VGLGGRLDATHAWDGGVAVVTNVGLDHQQYLGDTIEAIAKEKDPPPCAEGWRAVHDCTCWRDPFTWTRWHRSRARGAWRGARWSTRSPSRSKCCSCSSDTRRTSRCRYCFSN